MTTIIRQFTDADLIRCAEREVRQRERVYARLVEQDRMSIERAGREIAMMQEISALLQEQAQTPKQGQLF